MLIAEQRQAEKEREQLEKRESSPVIDCSPPVRSEPISSLPKNHWIFVSQQHTERGVKVPYGKRGAQFPFPETLCLPEAGSQEEDRWIEIAKKGGPKALLLEILKVGLSEEWAQAFYYQNKINDFHLLDLAQNKGKKALIELLKARAGAELGRQMYDQLVGEYDLVECKTTFHYTDGSMGDPFIALRPKRADAMFASEDEIPF